MNPNQDLEQAVIRQMTAQFAEKYNMGIDASISYTNQTLKNMKNSGLFKITYKTTNQYMR